METKAIVRGVRLSADKGRLVADLVRGKFGLDVTAAHVAIGCGAKIFETLFCQAFLDPGDVLGTETLVQRRLQPRDQADMHSRPYRRVFQIGIHSGKRGWHRTDSCQRDERTRLPSYHVAAARDIHSCEPPRASGSDRKSASPQDETSTMMASAELHMRSHSVADNRTKFDAVA